MNFEQLKSLTSDELGVLAVILNKINPPVAPYELDTNNFVFVKHDSIMWRIDATYQFITDAGKPILDTLKNKLNIDKKIMDVEIINNESIKTTCKQLEFDLIY
jgi:hypothetical protein